MARQNSKPNRKARRHPPLTRVSIDETIQKFKSHSDVEIKLRCAHDLSTIAVGNTALLAAEMYAEAAAHPQLTITEKQEVLGRSEHLWKTVRESGNLGRRFAHGASEAAVKLALFPSLQWFVAGQCAPPLEQTKKDYETLLATNQEISEIMKAEENGPQRSRHRGTLAEASVQLLLMRFVIDNPDVGYTPLFSFFSQDQGSHKGSVVVDRWDISVYGEDRDHSALDLQHKIQVKSSMSGFDKGHIYADDITTVFVSEDLALGKRSMNIETIGIECLAELRGGTQERAIANATAQLDTRTEKLLDLMG